MRMLRKPLALLLALAMALSLLAVPTYAEEEAPAASFVNTTQDGGKDMISLESARTFKASIPVDLSLADAQAQAENVTWSLTRDTPYLSEDLYPNYYKGDALESFTRRGTDPNTLFYGIETGAEEVDGQVYLTVTFGNYYFIGDDSLEWSHSHSMGHGGTDQRTAMDYIGLYQLTAAAGEDILGSVQVRVNIYDNFRTMDQIYEEIDQIVAAGEELDGLYVDRRSMGLSSGVNGFGAMDMPYLIVAKDKEAVDNWLELCQRAETEPEAVLAEIEAGTLDVQVPVLYSNIHSNEIAAPDGILDFAWMLIEAAQSESHDIDYNLLTGYTEEGQAKLENQMEICNLAVPDLVKDTATYLGWLTDEISNFSDVAETDWFYTPVYLAAQAEIVNGMGDGSFAPNAPVTREQAAKMIVQATGCLDDTAEATFTDMNLASDWAVPYIASAQAAGLMKGNDDGTFRPQGTMTRAELAALIVNAMELTSTEGAVNFSDVKEGDWFASAVAMASAAGYVQGESSSSYNPTGSVTRAAFAQVIYNMYLKNQTYLSVGNRNYSSNVVDLDAYYTTETKTVDLYDDLLDNVFFIIVPEENVEGRAYITRYSSGGHDLNRDNSFQTQVETQNMSRLIATYNPVSFTEFHGRVTSFQVEPCDPPHEPNFEYDLLAEHLLAGGEALGIAAVANNDGFNSYVMPQRDYLIYTGETTETGEAETYWEAPWDDMSTSYTPQYSMLHGCCAYTVELPAYNNDSTQAVAYGILGQAAYVAENAASYLTNQVTIYKRGVNNENTDAYELNGQWYCDQYDVEGAEADLFRPEYDGEGQNGNFFPECYIIPLDGEHQTNLQAACDMVEWLARNDVTVLISTEEFTYDGVTYPAGTAVISMYQAKRSVANSALYDGTVITTWTELYSEGITAFSHTRGFDMATCAEPAAYEGIAAACGTALTTEEEAVAYISTQVSYFTGVENADVILSNASEDSTAAVNALLQAGKTVAMITEGEYTGDFLCSYEDWASVCGQYLISGTGVDAAALGITAYLLEDSTVYITGTTAAHTPADYGFAFYPLVVNSTNYNYDRQAMELMGFQTTADAAQADVVLGATALDSAALTAVQSGTPYMGYGSSATSSIGNYTSRGNQVDGSLFGDDFARSSVGAGSMDALSYVTYQSDSLVTASYVADGDNILYGYGCGWFSTIPEGAQVLVQLDSEGGFLEGFICQNGSGYEAFTTSNPVQAISYQGADRSGNQINICLFANSLTNKVHQRDDYGYIANFIFSNAMTDVPYVG